MKKLLTIMALFSLGLLVCQDGNAQSTYRIIHHFDGATGAWPYGHLISEGGKLYGMTGGDTTGNTGTVFSIDPDGSNHTVLHRFAGQPTDGQWPHGSLFAQSGNLYGITWAGGCGLNNCPNAEGTGCGTLFSMSPDGSAYNSFWQFACGGGDGYASLPNAHFISDGQRLYSTTGTGGQHGNGTVFAVNPDGTGFVVLNTFDRSYGDLPTAGLALSDGVLYGTTSAGGDHNRGTVFSVRTDGSDFTALHHFTGPDGEMPGSTPVLYGDRLFGVTMYGGDNNRVIFLCTPTVPTLLCCTISRTRMQAPWRECSRCAAGSTAQPPATAPTLLG